MALADGDFRLVEEKVTAALLADTEEGGLRETGAPAVASARPGDAALVEALGQAEFPALLVRAESKKEEPGQPAAAVLKSFLVRVLAAERGHDREAAEAKTRRIAARVEEVLRRQNRLDQQLGGLADLIEGAEGVLFTTLTETRFQETVAGTERILARATVEVLIQVPCAFRYE